MIKLDRPLIKKHHLLLFIFCLVSGLATAQTVNLHAPTDSLTVGQVFDFSISVKSSQEFKKVIFPDSTAFGSDLEFLSSKHFKVSNLSDSAEFKLQYFAVENVSIPPLPIRVVTGSDTNLVFTSPVSLLYKQTITDEEAEFKPLKPNFKFPRAIWPYIIALLILLGAGYFIWWKYFKNKVQENTKPKPIPVFENPLAELESILVRIKKEHTDAPKKDFKWFYSELGDALRWYIEELYKIPALESTTREALRYIDAFGVDVEMVKHARAVLNEADMAKFAKFKPTLDQSWKAYNEGLLFLERAKKVDSDRIARLKSEFEHKFIKDQEDEHGMG